MSDVSGILAAGNLPKQPDFLTQYGTVQNILNSQEQNKLLQQEVLQSQAGTASTQQQTDARLLGLAGGWAYALSNDPNLTPQLARDSFNHAAELAPTLAPKITALQSHITDDMPVDQLRGMLRRVGFAPQPPEIQQRMNTPDISWQTSGQYSYPYATYKPGNQTDQPAGTPMQAGPGIKQELTQEQLSTIGDYPDLDPDSPTYGQTAKMTKGEYLRRQGSHGLLPGAGPGGPAQSPAQSTAPTPTPAPTGGPPRLKPAQGTSQGAPAAPATAPTNPVETPSVKPPMASNSPYGRPSVSSLPPGTEQEWDTSAKQYAADQVKAASYGQRVQPMYQALDLLKKTTTGWTPEMINPIKGALASAASYFGAVDPKYFTNIGEAQDLNKTFQQIVNSSPMAQGSDQRLGAVLGANAGMHLGNLANEQVVKAALALTRMEHAANATYKGPIKDYGKYLKNYASTVDPRAFIFDQLNPDERKKMLAGMKTVREKQFFNESLDIAASVPGLLGVNTAMPPGQ